MDGIFKRYSAVRQPQVGLDPALVGDHAGLLHFGYVVEFSKALRYAQGHDALRDPATRQPVDWNNPPDWIEDECRCMGHIVSSFSRQHGFTFHYASVMDDDAPAHAISLYSNQQTNIRRSLKMQRTMHLLSTIEQAFDVKDQPPMWWWDSELSGVGFKSVVEKYNPLPRQSTTLKKRGRGRRLEDAQLNSTMSDLRVS